MDFSLSFISTHAPSQLQSGFIFSKRLRAPCKASVPLHIRSSVISSSHLTEMARLLSEEPCPYSWASVEQVQWIPSLWILWKLLSCQSDVSTCSQIPFSNASSEGWLHLVLKLGLCIIYFCSCDCVVDFAFNYLSPENIGSQINVYHDMHMQFIALKLSEIWWNTQSNWFLKKAEF